MNILESLKWRYATKIFDKNKSISDNDFNTIKEALIVTPSSFGLQPWEFLFIEDTDLREKLKPVSWGQSQITDASKLLVICSRTNIDEAYIDSYLESISETRGVELSDLSAFRDMMISKLLNGSFDLDAWAKNQTYIALGNIMTVCALLKLDTCPIEGFEKDKYDEILGLKEKNLSTSVVCPIGYRSEDDKYAKLPKVRFGEDLMIREI